MLNQKANHKRYKVIPRTLVFLFKNHEVLLIKNIKRGRFGFGKWNGLGGHIEKGENPIEAAKREVLEESGISIRNLELDYITLLDSDDRVGICLFIFHGYVNNKKFINADEGDLCWIAIDKLNQIDCVVDAARLIKLIRSKPKKQLPVFLKYYYAKNDKLIIKEIF